MDTSNLVSYRFGIWPNMENKYLIYTAGVEIGQSISIAVVVPAHNASRTIINSIESILQTLTDGDHIFIVENGSTDETWNILVKNYSSNASVTLIQAHEANVSSARNAGVAAARAYDYIAFCDADDVWSKNKIRVAKELIRREHPDILFHPMLSIGVNRLAIEGGSFIDKKLPRSKKLYLDLARYGNFFPTSAMVVKRDKMLANTFLPSLKHTQDYEAWCALAYSLPEIKVMYVESILGIHYWMGGLSNSVVDRMRNIKTISSAYLADAPILFRFSATLRINAHILWWLFRTSNISQINTVLSNKIDIGNLRKIKKHVN